MVGNDVVDLTDPDCSPATVHPRFDQRVFSASELRMIHASAAPIRMRWCLWAAKESAYKLLRKIDSAVAFAPSRFVVQLDATTRFDVQNTAGTVTHADRRIPFHVFTHTDALHVVATWPSGSRPAFVATVAQSTSECLSSAVRRLAVDTVAAWIGVVPHELRIAREGRIPRLQLRGQPLPIDLSLSHHGRFVAFAALGDWAKGMA